MPETSPEMSVARTANGFTLIELLVVIAILSLLMSLLVPSLSAAKEMARAAKVHAELYGLGLALEMYGMDQGSKYPPVRVNCNSDLREHWCQLPVELAAGGYVPKGPPDGGLAAAVEDEFNAGHTYKYAAPGPGLLNGGPGYNHEMWVPDDFPQCHSATGRYYSDVKTAPVKWAVWSLGPQPKSAKSQSPYTPLSWQTWYTRTHDTGVLVRFATREGLIQKSP
jgi:prepilin-type N-terminal cleavage/methylation domain-containing protein